MTDCETVQWHDCYSGNWKGVLTDAAFAHPAKFSRSLIERVIAFGLEQGFWRVGDTLADLFFGVGCGGIIAAYSGLRVIGVELEPRFCALAQANIDLHRYKLEKLGCPIPVVVQGDSRRFSEIIRDVVGQIGALPAGSADAILSSSPWGEVSRDRVTADDRHKFAKEHGISNCEHVSPIDIEHARQEHYGQTEGQIGAMKEGDLSGIVTSPPFSTDQPCASQTQAKKDYHAFTRGDGTKRDKQMTTEGNIASLPPGECDGAITSPPYADVDRNGIRPSRAANLEKAGIDSKKWLGNRRCTEGRSDGYGETEGQIGALADKGGVDGAVTSPPWESNGDAQRTCNEDGTAARQATSERGTFEKKYGQTDGQIGKEVAETYWSACAQVYREMWKALKPGGVAAIVLKDFVRAGQRVPLCDQTCRLLEHVGFTVFLRVQAMLTKEWTEPDLFDGPQKKRKERKSFFRRLHESRPGAVRIDEEEVIWCRRL